jgi:predicted transposase YdaD
LKYYRDFINVLDTTKQDTRREIAKNLLAMGLDIEAIVKATGLTEEMILQ